MEDRKLLKDPDHKSPFLYKKLPKFVDFFASKKRVLEIGCGWGEFLELLKARGVEAEAVELDKKRAAYSKAKGFKIYAMKGQDFLKRCPVGRYDGLFMSNIIEHLQVAEAVQLLKAAHGRLAPGGRVAITTANARSLGIIADAFWNDMQHTRPYPLPALCEMLEDQGFTILKAETDEDSRPRGVLRWIIRKLRTLLVGPYFEAAEIFVMAEKAR